MRRADQSVLGFFCVEVDEIKWDVPVRYTLVLVPYY